MYVFLFLATPLGSSPRGYSGFRVTGMIEGFLFGMEFSILGFSFAREGGGGGGGGVPPPPKSIKQNKNISFCSFIDGEFLNSTQARSCSKGIELFVLEIQSSMHEVKGS